MGWRMRKNLFRIGWKEPWVSRGDVWYAQCPGTIPEPHVVTIEVRQTRTSDGNPMLFLMWIVSDPKRRSIDSDMCSLVIQKGEVTIQTCCEAIIIWRCRWHWKWLWSRRCGCDPRRTTDALCFFWFFLVFFLRESGVLQHQTLTDLYWTTMSRRVEYVFLDCVWRALQVVSELTCGFTYYLRGVF